MDSNSLLVKFESLGYEDTPDTMLDETNKYLHTQQHLVQITGGKMELSKNIISIRSWQLKEGK